jgi:hypothetical protein
MTADTMNIRQSRLTVSQSAYVAFGRRSCTLAQPAIPGSDGYSRPDMAGMTVRIVALVAPLACGAALLVSGEAVAGGGASYGAPALIAAFAKAGMPSYAIQSVGASPSTLDAKAALRLHLARRCTNFPTSWAALAMSAMRTVPKVITADSRGRFTIFSRCRGDWVAAFELTSAAKAPGDSRALVAGAPGLRSTTRANIVVVFPPASESLARLALAALS